MIKFNNDKCRILVSNEQKLASSSSSSSEQSEEDRDSIDARQKNKLVKSILTRCGHWVNKQLQNFEFNKLRVYSRDYYNKHRHMALALGKIHETENIMNANEANMLKSRFAAEKADYT